MNHIARVFKSGNSQAVRLPKAFRVDVDELEIFQRGDELVLRKPASNLEQAFNILSDLPDDFFAEGREDLRLQEREDL
ncbi:antitoxin [Alkanindiges sp. WGS2144]|uniref:antitoxin n=1 Tax=Alkanindiges sp. WGS2144 TaxID=3366808 RepID=UPI003751CF9B